MQPGFFHTIETVFLPSGYNCSIVLRDVVGSSSIGANVVFDAIRFPPVTSSIDEKITAELLSQMELALLQFFLILLIHLQE